MGQFLQAGETPANHIAMWDGDELHALGSGLYASLNQYYGDLLVDPMGRLNVTGYFTQLAARARSICAVDRAGCPTHNRPRCVCLLRKQFTHHRDRHDHRHAGQAGHPALRYQRSRGATRSCRPGSTGRSAGWMPREIQPAVIRSAWHFRRTSPRMARIRSAP